MSTPSQDNLVKRLTRERLSSYLESSDGDTAAAISLYDWNASVGSSLQADLGRIEVLFRNTVDQSLRDYGSSQGWPEPWHRRRALFAGKSCAHDWSDVRIAHYEPIHQRNLAQDYAEMLEIIRWICPDCHAWAEAASSTPAILSERP